MKINKSEWSWEGRASGQNNASGKEFIENNVMIVDLEIDKKIN